MEKKNILNFTLKELEKEIAGLEEPAYRAKQVFFWIYKKGAPGFNEFRNVPKGLKSELERNYFIGGLELSERLKSADQTEKFLFALRDENFIETVLIPSKNRNTVCLSMQVGCKFGCTFCASGLGGFVRNLTAAEILGQIIFLKFVLKRKITNYVFMGMGEPLDNFENLSKAIAIMTDADGMDIGSRRIAVSTCGIIPGIEKLENLGIPVNLSVSLHATNDKLRNELVPVNKRYPLERLIKACREYAEKTGRMLTIEYVLIKDKNDSPGAADELAKIAKKIKAKVNLIPHSGIAGLPFRPPDAAVVSEFSKRLIKKGVTATVRESKGKDILAACGQLRRRNA